MTTSEEKIRALLPEYFKDTEYFLVDVVSKGNRIEVYIDGDGKMHIDKCVEVSRMLEEQLETGGFVKENYLLEVSSPGMSNPIKVLRQYKKYIGRSLDLLMLDGQRKEGTLKAVDEEKLVIEESVKVGKKAKDIELREVEVPFSELKSAKRKISF